jgi:hypothetical protein
MICSRLIQDGELAFFKGERGRQGKAVHEDCRSDTGGGWYDRNCAVTYRRNHLGISSIVTDYALDELQRLERLVADQVRIRDGYRENGWTQEMLAQYDAAFAAGESERQEIIALCESGEFTLDKLKAIKSTR